MGDDRNQGQNEAEEAKTKADQGGKEKRQGQQQGKAKTSTVQRISQLSGAAKRVETQTLLTIKDNTHSTNDNTNDK
jgi:acetyl-CoA carboxylase carboxyltransferase component